MVCLILCYSTMDQWVRLHSASSMRPQVSVSSLHKKSLGISCALFKQLYLPWSHLLFTPFLPWFNMAIRFHGRPLALSWSTHNRSKDWHFLFQINSRFIMIFLHLLFIIEAWRRLPISRCEKIIDEISVGRKSVKSIAYFDVHLSCSVVVMLVFFDSIEDLIVSLYRFRHFTLNPPTSNELFLV